MCNIARFFWSCESAGVRFVSRLCDPQGLGLGPLYCVQNTMLCASVRGGQKTLRVILDQVVWGCCSKRLCTKWFFENQEGSAKPTPRRGPFRPILDVFWSKCRNFHFSYYQQTLLFFKMSIFSRGGKKCFLATEH